MKPSRFKFFSWFCPQDLHWGSLEKANQPPGPDHTCSARTKKWPAILKILICSTGWLLEKHQHSSQFGPSGAGLLKRGGGGELAFFLFKISRFVIFTFRNYFTICNIVLCIWRKIFIFCHHNFKKNGHCKLFKNEPENIP